MPIAEYYARAFAAAKRSGCAPTEAVARVAELYLDGKPRGTGGKRFGQPERDGAFFSWRILGELPARAWREDPLLLALARYLAQDRVAAPGLLAHVASVAPEQTRRAIRLSGLVLKPGSPRRAEVAGLARTAPLEFGEFGRTLEIFFKAHRQRKELVSTLREPFADLSPVAFLAYASLYAFKHLVADGAEADGHRIQTAWEAVAALLEWKLATSADGALRLTDDEIAKSLAIHVSPFLFPTADGPPPRFDLLDGFEELMDAQVELDEFVARSAEAFCYDHAIDFVPEGDGLDIVELDPAANSLAKDRWYSENDRLARLHRYWLLRGMDAFVDAGLGEQVIGRPENSEMNRAAYVKAMAAHLRLVEVYGVGTTVSTAAGGTAPLFKALLSLELMTAFYDADFVRPYRGHLDSTGGWRDALCLLALGSLATGHNRFPVTWSRRDEKVRRITGWTVDAEHPRGSRREAEAILDLWTCDCRSLARRLRSAGPGLLPELYERPILKLGGHLFQLPWLTAFQNNQTAGINNLRRLGARRAEARDETRRIEERLAGLLRGRGFAVRLNHTPPATDGDDPGEVDLVCARDGAVLVLEVKSTFVRKSARDTWLRGSHALGRAGRQLRRKVPALAQDTALADALGIDPVEGPAKVCAWIVDTSIEHDHERFGGLLKVSLEELIIAPRDDRHLLNEADRILAPDAAGAGKGDRDDEAQRKTLYPTGFSFAAFVDAIESESVWVPYPVTPTRVSRMKA